MSFFKNLIDKIRETLSPQIISPLQDEPDWSFSAPPTPPPRQGETIDNRITNSLIDAGKLPEAQREIYPQQSGLGLADLLKGFGKYGATPSAQAVQEMVKAQSDYPVFRDNPALLPGVSIIESSAGRNMTRPRNDPTNLLNWGIYTDFMPKDQAHSVSRAASGIGERMSYYEPFRQSGKLEDFTSAYAPASDGNEGYLNKLLSAMQHFQ